MLKYKPEDNPMRNEMSIVNYGEFIDALAALQREQPIIMSDGVFSDSIWLDGARIYYAFNTLKAYNLIEKFDPCEYTLDEPSPFLYYRLNIAGKAYANRSLKEWKSLPIWKRALIRFCL